MIKKPPSQNLTRKTPTQKKDIVRPPDPSEKIRDAKEPFARLFRMIIYHMKMTPERWDGLFVRYLDELYKGKSVTVRKRSSDRGNFNDAFLSDTMTGRNFINAIRLLYPLKARLSVHLEFPFVNLSKSLLIFSRDKEELDMFEGMHIDDETGKITNSIGLLSGGQIDLTKVDIKLYNRVKRVIDEYQGESTNEL